MKIKKHLRRNSEKIYNAIEYFYPKYDLVEKGEGIFSVVNREGAEIYEFSDKENWEKVYYLLVDLLPELKEFLPVPKTEALELDEIKERYGEDISRILKEKFPHFQYYLVLVEYEDGWGCVDEYYGDKVYFIPVDNQEVEIDEIKGDWAKDGFGGLEKVDTTTYCILQNGKEYLVHEVFQETDKDYDQRFVICGGWNELHIEIPEDIDYYVRYIPVEEEESEEEEEEEDV